MDQNIRAALAAPANSIPEILQFLGVAINKNTVRGGVICDPRPNHSESNPSFSISRMGDGIWLWKRHGGDDAGGNVIDLLVAFGYDVRDAMKLLNDRSGYAANYTARSSRIATSPSPQIDIHKRLVQAQLYVAEMSILPDVLNNRGFTHEICKKFGIGVENNKILIPIHRNGQLLSLKIRNPPAATVRYSYAPDGRGAPAWIHRNPLTNTWLIVEGELNAIAACSALNSMVSVQGIAGTSNYPELDGLCDCTVYIYADGDDSGKNAAIKWAKTSLEAGATVVKILEPLPNLQDFCDYLALHSAEALETFLHRVMQQSTCITSCDDLEKWATPLPCDDTLPAVKMLSENDVPDAISDFCADLAQRLNIPVTYCAVAAIAAISGVIGRGCGIRPKMYDDWLVIPNLWAMLIAPSSIGKSPVLDAVLSPINELQNAAFVEAKSAIAATEMAREILELQEQAIKSQLKKTVSETAKTDLIAVRTEIEELAKPTVHRFIVNDVTDPQLCVLLEQNPRGLLLVRDELAGFLQKLEVEHYSQQLYLELWNGNANITVDRKLTDGARVNGGCLSILGGIQPAKLQNYISEAYKSGASDGFLPRFQLSVWADQYEPWQFRDSPPNLEARKKYAALINAVANGDFIAIGAEQPDAEQIPFFSVSDDAYAIFRDYQIGVGRRLVRDSFGSPDDEFLGKLGKLFASLMLIFHVLDCILTAKPSHFVARESAELTHRWCQCLETHHCKILALGQQSAPEYQLARLIERGDVYDGMPVRELERKQRAGLRNRQQIDAAIEDLTAKNWLRLETRESVGRPSTVIRIHPKFRKMIDG